MKPTKNTLPQAKKSAGRDKASFELENEPKNHVIGIGNRSAKATLSEWTEANKLKSQK